VLVLEVVIVLAIVIDLRLAFRMLEAQRGKIFENEGKLKNWSR
jgi:hypothetical protein